MSMCIVQNDSIVGWRVHPAMLYDGKENSGICLEYILNIHGIFLNHASNWIYWFISAKKLMKLPSWFRTSMYKSLLMLGTWSHHSKYSFYSAWIFSMNTWKVYTRHIPSIYISDVCCSSLASIPQASWSPKCAWMSKTFTFCWFFQFWLLKVFWGRL